MNFTKLIREFKSFVILLWITLVFACLLIPLTSKAQTYDESQAEDLVLAVFANRERLSAGIFAVQQENRYYLPVGALSDVFGFYYETDLNNGIIEGRTLSEDSEYVIDTVRKTLEYNNQKVSLPEEVLLDASIADDDIYILLEVFEEIWPLELSVDLGSLILRADVFGKLPYQLALERKVRQERLEKERELAVEIDEEDLTFLPYPYQAFGKPSQHIGGSAHQDMTPEQMEVYIPLILEGYKI